uniref:Uncharacterized protein n=1 Tax=Cupriavidus taiwanensis TaxID=164546 RepID=A0A375HDD6_9BURK|nr:protein of unknown function [Cupriavidus taiwanensis]
MSSLQGMGISRWQSPMQGRKLLPMCLNCSVTYVGEPYPRCMHRASGMHASGIWKTW